MAGWRAHGRRVRLHGRGLGRVHLRAQHDRRARRSAHARRPVQLEPLPRVHALLCDRHVRSYERAGRRLVAAQVPRAARPVCRLRLHAGARAVQRARPREEALAARGFQNALDRFCRRGGGCFGRAGGALAHGLFRATLVACARPLRQAHAHGQPARRLGRRAPARERPGLLPILANVVMLPCAGWVGVSATRRVVALRQVVAGHADPGGRAAGGQDVLAHVRRRRVLLLQQDGPVDYPSRSGRVGALGSLRRPHL